MKHLSFVLALFCLISVLSGQTVTGTITDETGTPLPFATISVKGTDAGTTASFEGTYTISIDAAEAGSTLEFRYIGYEVLRKKVDASSSTVTLDVQLVPATYQLDIATVDANTEDPAYRIMREVAARREQYLRADEQYEVNVYVKGQLQIVEAPEKIMGQEIGDMGGLLDSSRAGIVYLSETYSTLQVEQPDRYKETVTASKVSGDPRGYSFNSAVGVDFDLYRKITDYSKPILSPLTTNAPGTYRFTLEGSRRTEDDKLIYRIGIKPREDFAPAYTGTLYIEDGSFHLLDADLYLLGRNLNAPGLDTLLISQSYRQRNDAGWEVYQRRIEPVLGLLGFRFRGIFTSVYSGYNYSPNWQPSPFGKTITEILPESNKVDSSIFDLRPIPLTRAEQRDYVRKDSIRQIEESPAYRDSIETRRNKFNFGSLLGYTHYNWRKNSRWKYSSPLEDNGFHSVTGLQLGLGVEYSEAIDDQRSKEFTIGGKLQYGWADEQFYTTAYFSQITSKKYETSWNFRGGRELTDYHRLNPVGTSWNAIYSIFNKENPLKLYDRLFLEVSHTSLLRASKSTQATPFARITHAITLEERNDRSNASTYSIRKKDKLYQPNIPLLDVDDVGVLFNRSTLFRYSGKLEHTPGERFIVRPDAITAIQVKWPTLSFAWRYGIENKLKDPIFPSNPIHFLFTSIEARRDNIRLARMGRFSGRLGLGTALFYKGRREIIDYQLFNGSELLFNGYSDYLTRYLALDHYDFATEDSWIDGALEHDFNGWIWRRLPLLRRIGWTVVGRAAAIYLPQEERSHSELGVAISNIGFGVARFIRVDAAWARQSNDGLPFVSGNWQKPVYRIGLNIPFSSDSGGEISIGTD